MNILQTPLPGKHCLLFRGDVLEFGLKIETGQEIKGRAFLRTNIGRSAIRRNEIIEAVETKRQRRGQDWHDVPMEKTGVNTFSISIALLEVGHFEAKCFYFPDNASEPIWVQGNNVHINVEPAEYCCANSIYCAFVRQFGQNKNKPSSKPFTGIAAPEIHKLDSDGYSLIPPSGTFRNLIKELDFIIDGLNCRIIHLLPINPTPTVFARMGRYGSPYASLDFTAVDPALAEFDRKATPLDQFLELVDTVHRRNAKVFLDIAVNHTGWAAKIHEEHPEWLVRENDGSIHSPGAWGVVWGDLTELNHRSLELWKHIAHVFLVWCGRGVDGFRCDAGYMIPIEAWEFIIASVRNEYPDTIFFLEGLGGDPAMTLQLLDKANMNWAYSELFQNYTKNQIQSYVPYAQDVSFSDGLMVHYAETHDNNRLAARSPVYAQMRTALCALTSSNGAFGFTNGVEWFASEKIDVHEANALNWGSRVNQAPHIARLNSILISHPAFYNNSSIKFIESGNENALSFLRADSEKKKNLLVLINLDCENISMTVWRKSDVPFDSGSLIDLITEEHIVPAVVSGEKYSLVLAQGQALCLTGDIQDLLNIAEAENKHVIRPDRIVKQSARAMALDIICWKNRSDVILDIGLRDLAMALLSSPLEFLRSLYGGRGEVPVVIWQWPHDLKRKVMIPPGHFIIIQSPFRFRARIAEDGKILVQRDSLKNDADGYFAVFTPLPPPAKHSTKKIKMSVYAEKKSHRDESEILFLALGEEKAAVSFSNREIRSSYMTFLGTNGRGGMLRPCLQWGELKSRYDVFLAANLNPDYPEDRHVMWRRCRMWIDYHGRREYCSLDTTENFTLDCEGGGTWTFHIPAGSGLFVDISVNLAMIKGENAVKMNIYRHLSEDDVQYLSDEKAVKITVRPDIEDRNFHMETKAMHGPEQTWPRSIAVSAKSFVFTPWNERGLQISAFRGKFRPAPEWVYSIYHERESARGLEPFGDLFSPGYFETVLGGGEGEQIIGHVFTQWENKKIMPQGFKKIPAPADSSAERILLSALEQFVVRRNNLKTVIAGYPWFLDWGRDTLICARGLIAAGKMREVSEILLLFAKFAKNGTLPNMICGENSGNRDASDAPLWLFTACADFCREKGGFEFLNTPVKENVTLLGVLKSIAENYIGGTPNGIKMDAESGLVYSPPHFTWMDTNFPAATPREGYPVEIQALWYSALNLLAVATGADNWKVLADKVKKSFNSCFSAANQQYLSDCLHARSGQSALRAQPDDALRPNQLLAVTFGLVGDFEFQRNILQSVSSLLIPGAMRSLADAPVEFPIPVYGNGGRLLNDPKNPYWGRYEGDEDTRRKPAYHNGTAWTWLFPSYPEAFFMTFGESGRRTAKSILSSSKFLLEQGCVGSIPEILDGDFPHLQRGCDAQAWGVAELYRVWKFLGW